MPGELDYVRENYLRIRAAVEEAALRCGRDPNEITLMAVTKTVEERIILEAVAAGAACLGENRVQELERKREALSKSEAFRSAAPQLHLIGHLQSNKLAKAVACADMIQSVDSLRLAKALSEHCVKSKNRISVLLEVNVGADPAKYGFAPEQLKEELHEICQMQGILVRGLMTVPPISGNLRDTAIFFSNLRKLFLDFQCKKMDNISMEILSMGMSHDFEVAIAEGATLVRVGSAIFGKRDYR
ncbi:MAG: YggS family pyridoxal phosphate-dependent enzyme [Oscillospiraceae bacterium]|jgi:pyridoxal phosphate enzyme (YggS family)|nr:YggS family pyridoxal phosphate-dependent enzyme [Oscillospiraceae bacterium]